MDGRGSDTPPANGGEFLLQLLRKPSSSIPLTLSPPQQRPSQALTQDPAVAAVGPTIPTFPPPHAAFPVNDLDLPHVPWQLSTSPPFAPHYFFQQNPRPNPNLNPDFSSPPGVFGHTSQQFHPQPNRVQLVDDTRKLGPHGGTSKSGEGLIFGSLNRDILHKQGRDVLYQNLYGRNSMESSYPEEGPRMDRKLNGIPLNSIGINAIGMSTASRGYDRERGAKSNDRRKEVDNGGYRAVAPPPGFSTNVKNVGSRDVGFARRSSNHDVDKGKGNFVDGYRNDRLSNQLDSPGLPAGSSSLPSVSAFDIEESVKELHGEDGGGDKIDRDRGQIEIDELEDHLVESLGLVDESGEKSDKKKYHRDKDYRSDKRGKWIMGQRMRNIRRYTMCRNDIDSHNASFLAVFESLIPADEEKVKQKQLLMTLEKIITKEWPDARLYLYGSCANSFGFSKSDIDVCLAMEPRNIDKSEVLLKLADLLQSDNLQNVQALTRARVPIVKLMDPGTGISCDICINNLLAVVNTKLLRDYAQIDARLRQLAFIVKHWAKSRGVNQTYQGTLSSYAYVLMCIHFLQQRTPAILPCLQRMEVTYSTKLDDIDCSYFDRVEMIENYGFQNRESVARLVWGFFHYWAYCHDYANDVISIRTGSTLLKRVKDWTRRVGNDRHLICIEDPFEVSHDLGRVVDRYSIRVLREEFERAAEIMQHDPIPSVTLFEPYVTD